MLSESKSYFSLLPAIISARAENDVHRSRYLKGSSLDIGNLDDQPKPSPGSCFQPRILSISLVVDLLKRKGMDTTFPPR
jgi:hypothetical protein